MIHRGNTSEEYWKDRKERARWKASLERMSSRLLMIIKEPLACEWPVRGGSSFIFNLIHVSHVASSRAHRADRDLRVPRRKECTRAISRSTMRKQVVVADMSACALAGELLPSCPVSLTAQLNRNVEDLACRGKGRDNRRIYRLLETVAPKYGHLVKSRKSTPGPVFPSYRTRFELMTPEDSLVPRHTGRERYICASRTVTVG
jgi:hypothetical protein